MDKRIIIITAALACACTASDPVKRDMKADAGVAVELEPPVLEMIPGATPGTTIAIRGTADGSRIVVTGGPDVTSSTGVLPSGTFCHDATLSPNGPTELEIFTVDGSGGVSEPVIVEVSQESTAAMPADATCSGSTGKECQEVESCSLEGDEDCDGQADACDSDCNGCIDDAYEPNDTPFAVPTLPGRGVYELELCPCRPDWFAFYAQEGERIRLSAAFDGTAMNLNMRLYPSATPDGSDYVDASFGSGDVEDIDYTAEASGTYYLQVYVFASDEEAKRGSYSLSVL